jgi:hypothetical protein
MLTRLILNRNQSRPKALNILQGMADRTDVDYDGSPRTNK